jgi:hypothetical protein
VPEPLPREVMDDTRLLDALARDLSGVSGRAGATAVRMIWTGDHVDYARRLQDTLVAPARAVLERRQSSPPSTAGAGWTLRRARAALQLHPSESR